MSGQVYHFLIRYLELFFGCRLRPSASTRITIHTMIFVHPWTTITLSFDYCAELVGVGRASMLPYYQAVQSFCSNRIKDPLMIFWKQSLVIVPLPQANSSAPKNKSSNPHGTLG